MTHLTRQHFQAFATAIASEMATRRRRGLEPGKLATAQAELASEVFARFNPKFDRQRFFKACGLHPSPVNQPRTGNG